MCQYVGGDLAVIRSQDENDFIPGLLKNPRQVQIEGAWPGLYRKLSDGNAFYWVDDTPLADYYSAWASYEPNGPQEELCVQIYASSYNPGKWNDMQCLLPASEQSKAPVVLCQKRLLL